MKQEQPNTIDIDGLMRLASKLPMFNRDPSADPHREAIDNAFKNAKPTRTTKPIKVTPANARELLRGSEHSTTGIARGNYQVVMVKYSDNRSRIDIRNPYSDCSRKFEGDQFRPQLPEKKVTQLFGPLSWNAAHECAHKLIAEKRTYYPFGYNSNRMHPETYRVNYKLTFSNGDMFTGQCTNLYRLVIGMKSNRVLRDHFIAYGIPRCEIL